MCVRARWQSLVMADESAALDAPYKAATNLVDCKSKLAKENVDSFAEV